MSNFYEGLAEVLEVDPAEINSTFSLEDANWDSLAIVSTIALIDECFDKTVSAEALGECKTVADIEALVNGKVQ